MKAAGITLSSVVLCMGVAYAQPKLHRVETYTVVYKQTGTMAGTMTVYSREFGYRRAELADVVLSMGTIKLPMKQRTIVAGEQVTSIDENAGTAETSKDPHFAKTVEGMAKGDAVKAILKSVWNAAPTGKSETIAGEACDDFAATDKKSTYCVTADGIFLFLGQGTAQTRFERTATAVRRGDGGPDEAFQVPANTAVTDGTDPN